ncbi:uncharacterized protein A4U43_C04F25150 [Asparagus officinalis]|uniref:Uncharacterized protein n=1 Tax=Asparagus officinalis TaxID=4686 RepID=A0A5P1F3J6_ASPOF|nr:uncharacterized protein A4U43_C04F25150 [Asparagus officinalis]
MLSMLVHLVYVKAGKRVLLVDILWLSIEIKKDGSMAKKLLDMEVQGLERIRAYKGSRGWENLVDNPILQVADINFVPSIEVDLVLAVVLLVDE